MFCRSCGAQNKDGASFCSACGTPLGSAGQAGGAFASQPAVRKKTDGKLIAIAAAAVVVVAFLLFRLFFGGGSPESVAEKCCKAVFKGDGKTIVSLMPDKVIKGICDEEDMTKKEMIAELNESLEDNIDDMDRRYDKWKVSCKVLDTVSASRSELRSVAEFYDDYYDVKVTDAKSVTVRLTLKADGDTETDTVDIVTIKVGGSWYLDYRVLRYIF